MNHLNEIQKIKDLITQARTQEALDSLSSLVKKAYPHHEVTVLVMKGEFSDYEKERIRLLNPKRSIVTRIHGNILDLLDMLVTQSVQKADEELSQSVNQEGNRPQPSKPKNYKDQKDGFTELSNKLFKK